MESIKINPHLLQKTPTFPVIRPIPKPQPKGWLARFARFLTYRREFLVLQPWVTWSEYIREYIYIPTGFVSDGASVPKMLNSLYGQTGVLLHGAFPHDFGYKYAGLILIDQETLHIYFQPYTKKELDRIFKASCAAESGLPVSSGIATAALKLFGWPTWNNYRKKNQKAFQDFPILFPGEELTT
ncbi:MAG: DUF1353 domain-containing protein [Desulfobacterales bacterium]|nr:DUF1353 domain-containing protein [Desulfobacterales bacterium]